MMRKLFFIILAYLIIYSKASPTLFIAGGEKAIEGQIPYQVSLRLNGTHYCGGSIISDIYILSASHCFQGLESTDKITVRVGSTNRFQGGIIVKIADIIYPNLQNELFNDIALARLTRPLIFSKNIQPIKLISKEVRSGSAVQISGWGLFTYDGYLPEKLYYVKLTLLNKTMCIESDKDFQESHICLAGTAGHGACFGDSGGPAVYNGQIVGVCSFGPGNCAENYALYGYTNVFKYLDWIKTVTNL